MKHLPHVLLALALASSPVALGCKGSSAATTPTAGDAVTIPLAPRAVGIRWIKTDDMTTDLKAGTLPIGGKRHYRTESEILEVGADGVVTRLAINYLERVELDLGPSSTGSKTSPLAGKAYVVWLEGGAIKAARPDATEVTPEELAELSEDQDELGKQPVMEQIIAGRTWKVGEAYAFTAAELDRLAEAKAGKGAKSPRATATTMTLERVVGGDAEFAMATRLENNDGMTMTIDFTGSVTIDLATGRPKRLAISGPVTGTAAGLAISGTMSGVVTYEFTGP